MRSHVTPRTRFGDQTLARQGGESMIRRTCSSGESVIITLLGAALLLGLTACASMGKDERVLVCQEVLRLVQPECARLQGVGGDAGSLYATLCMETFEDGIMACEAGIRKDPKIVCPRIAAKASFCEFIPDESKDREANADLCERVIHAAGLACTLALASHEAGEPVLEVPVQE